MARLTREQILVDADAMQQAKASELEGGFAGDHGRVTWRLPRSRLGHVVWVSPEEGSRKLWRAWYSVDGNLVSIDGPAESSPIRALHALGEQLVENLHSGILINIEEIAKLLGIEAWQDIFERAPDNVISNADAMIEGGEFESEEARQEAFDQAYSEIEADGIRKWIDAVEFVADREFGEWRLDVEQHGRDRSSWWFVLSPEPRASWEAVAGRVFETIVGYSGTGYASMEEWVADYGDARVAVEANLDSIGNRSQVFGDQSPQRRFENDFDG